MVSYVKNGKRYININYVASGYVLHYNAFPFTFYIKLCLMSMASD